MGLVGLGLPRSNLEPSYIDRSRVLRYRAMPRREVALLKCLRLSGLEERNREN